MVQPMLFLHWKQVRFVLLPFILAAYALPLLAVQGLGSLPGTETPSMAAYRIVADATLWLPTFPLLAAATGVTLALSSWNWDHQLGHVYALSLPITRRRYAVNKMAAGALLAVLPGLAFWIGAHVAVASIALPPGLHAYPDQLAVRFFTATLVAYALLSALAAGTMRTTVWLLIGVAAFALSSVVLSQWVFPRFGVLQHVDVMGWILRALSAAPGPFQVFSGNWTLIDV